MANRHPGEIEADIGGARRRLVLTVGRSRNSKMPSAPRTSWR